MILLSYVSSPGGGGGVEVRDFLHNFAVSRNFPQLIPIFRSFSTIFWFSLLNCLQVILAFTAQPY